MSGAATTFAATSLVIPQATIDRNWPPYERSKYHPGNLCCSRTFSRVVLPALVVGGLSHDAATNHRSVYRGAPHVLPPSRRQAVRGP
jgi:hypothetical protein